MGVALRRFAEIARRVDPAFPVRMGLPASQILTSYIGLPVEGKSDFEAIEGKRNDTFFAQAVGLAELPLCSRLAPAHGCVGCARSSVHPNLALCEDSLVTPHACFIAMEDTWQSRAEAYRAWLEQGVSDDELTAIRQHLQRERAFGSKRFQAMAERPWADR